MRQWLRDRWPAVRDNAVYDVSKFVAGLIVVGGGYPLMRYVLGALTPLTHDEIELAAVVVTSLLLAAVATTWAAAARVNRSPIIPPRRPEQRGAAVALPAPPSGLLSAVPAAPKETDFHIEIREILYRPRIAGLFIERGWDILLSLSATNRGVIEPTITDWSIEFVAGSERVNTSKVVTVPANLFIERPGPIAGTPLQEDIPRPTLDVLAHDPFRRGVPKTGWILMSLNNWKNIAPPSGAEITLTVKDSMGHEHQAHEPASFHEVKGEIKYR